MSADYLRERDSYDLTEAELHLANPCPPESRCSVCWPTKYCATCGAELDEDSYYSRRCSECQGEDDKRAFKAREAADDLAELMPDHLDEQTGFAEGV